MIHNVIPPLNPTPSKPIRPPMIYVKDTVKWEYKVIVRNLGDEEPLSEEELNTLGSEGWEMSGLAKRANSAFFYFKRLAD